MDSGVTVGVAVLALVILTCGVQLKTPVPLALNCNGSLRQIRVSRKAKVSIGLSNTVIGNETVFPQPLLLVTVNVTVFVPGVE